MLSQIRTSTPRRHRLLLATLLAAALLIVSAPRGRADDAPKSASAVTLAPADSAFFASILRNKELVDLFYNSNAYKTLRALPIVKQHYAKAMKDLSKEDGPIGMYKKFIEDKDNKELVEVLTEGVSDEIFVYGGKSWADFIKLALRINNAQSWAPLTALGGGDSKRAQVRSILVAAQKNRELIRFPEMVIGLKLKNARKAEAQIERLEKLAGAIVENVPPLKGRLKRHKVGAGGFLTIELDGSLIPWDDVNLKDYEEKKDEFDDLIKILKKTPVAISVGVKDGYLMFGITSTASELAKLDAKGPSLAAREELKPLAKFASRKLIGLSYASKEYLEASTIGQFDLASISETLKGLLAKAENLKDERKKAIAKDLDALIADAAKIKPRRGALVGVSYLTPSGVESYGWDYGDHSALKGVSLKLHENFGGNPIFAAAFGCKTTGENYRTLVKWITVVHGHVEAVLMDSAPEEIKEIYSKVHKALLPVWKRLDEITTKQFIPSVRDSGLGLVIDAKWSSKQWQKEVPALEKAMPMLELGLLVGINNPKGFERAITDYRKALNELYEKARENLPNKEHMPEFKLPAPQSEKVGSGTLFFYTIPDEAGLDKQVQPVMGVGKSVGVIALSKKHAERLMSNTPLTLKSGPLSRKGDVVGVAMLDWPQLVDTALPWIEFGLMATTLVPGDDAGGAEKTKKEIAAYMKQVKIAAEVLKCHKGGSSVSYLEDGKLVTFSQATVKDLDKVKE